MSAKPAPRNQPLKWYHSKSDSQIDVTGLVDVMTELGKMTRWGRDVRYTEHLMPRQKIALNLSTTRSFIYTHISLWVGVPSIVATYIMLGTIPAILMAFVTLTPVLWVLVWVCLNFLQGEGDLWADGARRVCLGVVQASIISVFVAVFGIIMGLVAHKWLTIGWAKLEEVVVQLQIPIDTKSPLLVKIANCINILLQDIIQFFMVTFVGTALCVLIPICSYAFVRLRENRIRNEVIEKFF